MSSLRSQRFPWCFITDRHGEEHETPDRAPLGAHKPTDGPLVGTARIKEVYRRIRLARSYGDAHNNAACRGERAKPIELYESLTAAEREKVPEQLWI